MTGTFKSLYRAYCDGRDGHVAVIFALAAVPLLVVTTAALDMHELDRYNTHISAALDSAALGAVANQAITVSEREALATNIFWDNVSDHPERVSFKVINAEDGRVELEADSRIPTSVLAITGRETFDIQANSTATVTRGGVVCMMTLDSESEGAFTVTEGAVLDAETCAVQVNSTHSRAAVINHGGRALAADFCVVGGADGPFDPFVNTECASIADPYKTEQAPDTGDCVDPAEVNRILSQWQASVSSEGVTLKPGTYCGGLDLQTKVVTFEPGVYTFRDGPLNIANRSEVTARGVTFVLQGENGYFSSSDGSVAYISAPTSGPTAGLAIFQDVHTNAKNFPSLPSATTNINDASNISIIGTVYLPHQMIEFKRGSLSQSQAPSTSFIGYRIRIAEAANIGVAVDHQSAGLPPIEPRHDESVRLER